MTLVFIGCSLLSLVIIHWQKVIKVPHDGRNVTVVWCVDNPLRMGGTSGGREGIKWHQPAHRQLWTCSNVKINKKCTCLRRNYLYWYKLCCDRFIEIIKYNTTNFILLFVSCGVMLYSVALYNITVLFCQDWKKMNTGRHSKHTYIVGDLRQRVWICRKDTSIHLLHLW